jgi:hypothetical protein
VTISLIDLATYIIYNILLTFLNICLHKKMFEFFQQIASIEKEVRI